MADSDNRLGPSGDRLFFFSPRSQEQARLAKERMENQAAELEYNREKLDDIENTDFFRNIEERREIITRGMNFWFDEDSDDEDDVTHLEPEDWEEVNSFNVTCRAESLAFEVCHNIVLETGAEPDDVVESSDFFEQLHELDIPTFDQLEKEAESSTDRYKAVVRKIEAKNRAEIKKIRKDNQRKKKKKLAYDEFDWSTPQEPKTQNIPEAPADYPIYSGAHSNIKWDDNESISIFVSSFGVDAFEVDQPTYDTEWFLKLSKTELRRLKLQYGLDHYLNENYDGGNFFRDKKLEIAFIPSCGGKSTVRKHFGKFVCDLDELQEYEDDSKKFKFFYEYSKNFEKWNVINNYWKELIIRHWDLINGRILLAHAPEQIPAKLLKASDTVIILPEIRKHGRREFSTNYDHLLTVEKIPKFRMDYRLYMYFMYDHFYNEKD